MFPARGLSKFKGSSNDGTMVPGMGSTTTVRYLPRYYSIILGPGLIRNYGQYTLYKYLVMGLELGLSDAGDISEDSS